MDNRSMQTNPAAEVAPSPYGELRTSIGTVMITTKATLELAKHLLDVLATQLPAEATRPTKKEESRKQEDKGEKG